MGEYADMIINGETCQYCMAEYPPEPVGHPWTCRECAHEMKPDKPHKRAKISCPECGKRVKEVGLQDHIRDVHEEAV